MLVKRYLSFIEKIKKSGKKCLKQLLDLAKKDVRTVTGHNLRSIMLLAGQNRIDDLDATADFEYHKLHEDEGWKANLAIELVEIRSGSLEVHGMEIDEIHQILQYVCTS